MNLGVTATQGKLTAIQWVHAHEIITSQFSLNEFHHGGCVGGDEALALIAVDETSAWVVLHRGDTPAKWSKLDDIQNEIRPQKDNLARNRDIVDETDGLLACPGEGHEVQRSGTWATIRYARKKGKPITIIFPSGQIRKENQ